MSGRELADAADEATRSLASATIRVEIVKRAGRNATRVSVNRAGECSGTVTVGETSFELAGTSEHLYVRAEKWSLGAASRAKADGRWIRWPWQDTEHYDAAFMCQWRRQMAQYALFDPDLAVCKGAATTLGATQVVPLTQRGPAMTVTRYVAATGTPCVHRVSGTRPDGTELTVDFGDFGKPVPVTPPAAEDVVDGREIPELADGGTILAHTVHPGLPPARPGGQARGAASPSPALL